MFQKKYELVFVRNINSIGVNYLCRRYISTLLYSGCKIYFGFIL